MNSFRETMVGIFVLLGLVCVAYLTIKLGKMDVFGQDGFLLKARFESVSGLRTGADVEMAGVPIGKVQSIKIDPDPMNSQAIVYILLDQDYKLSDDTIAAIKTSGLIGDKYVNLSRGGSEKVLADGDEIQETQSAVDIESLLGKYAFGGV